MKDPFVFSSCTSNEMTTIKSGKDRWGEIKVTSIGKWMVETTRKKEVQRVAIILELASSPSIIVDAALNDKTVREIAFFCCLRFWDGFNFSVFWNVPWTQQFVSLHNVFNYFLCYRGLKRQKKWSECMSYVIHRISLACHLSKGCT